MRRVRAPVRCAPPGHESGPAAQHPCQHVEPPVLAWWSSMFHLLLNILVELIGSHGGYQFCLNLQNCGHCKRLPNSESKPPSVDILVPIPYPRQPLGLSSSEGGRSPPPGRPGHYWEAAVARKSCGPWGTGVWPSPQTQDGEVTFNHRSSLHHLPACTKSTPGPSPKSFSQALLPLGHHPYPRTRTKRCGSKAAGSHLANFAHFTDKKTEAQRGEENFPKLSASQCQSPGPGLGFLSAASCPPALPPPHPTSVHRAVPQLSSMPFDACSSGTMTRRPAFCPLLGQEDGFNSHEGHADGQGHWQLLKILKEKLSERIHGSRFHLLKIKQVEQNARARQFSVFLKRAESLA